MPNVMSTEPNIKVERLGLVRYADALSLQKELMKAVIADKEANGFAGKEYLLLVEHPHVYTLGRHAREKNLLFPEEYYRSHGADVAHIDRGGDVTYHGPGQLVAYPIIDMEKHGLGVKAYVDFLEQTVIDLIALYGIKGERVGGATGVWIDAGNDRERKICAIGVKCSRFVTMHGLALNVNTDLEMFRLINPCGFTDKGVTSMTRETGHEVDMGEVMDRFTEVFLRNLNKI